MYIDILGRGLLLAIFLSSANATDSRSSDKCASIRVANERLKCYDSMAKKDSRKSDPSNPSITRNDARAKFINGLPNSDAKDDPLQRKVMICGVDEVLNETFGMANELDLATFQARATIAMNRFRSNMESENAEHKFKVLKCALNSDTAPQPMTEKGRQDRSSPLMDLDDLRVDMNSLGGKKVRVQGMGQYIGNIFFLTKNSSDLNPILVDITKLPRDQHRRIIQQCSDIMNGCRLMIHGTVGKVTFQDGIYAERIEW